MIYQIFRSVQCVRSRYCHLTHTVHSISNSRLRYMLAFIRGISLFVLRLCDWLLVGIVTKLCKCKVKGKHCNEPSSVQWVESVACDNRRLHSVGFPVSDSRESLLLTGKWAARASSHHKTADCRQELWEQKTPWHLCAVTHSLLLLHTWPSHYTAPELADLRTS